MKDYRIGIIGLGYVEFPLACLFAKRYPVVGFDLNETRVRELSAGVDRTGEVDSAVIEERLSQGLQCTAHIEDLRSCNVYIVGVPTPIDM